MRRPLAPPRAVVFALAFAPLVAGATPADRSVATPGGAPTSDVATYPASLGVSAQGILQDGGSGLTRLSPLGSYELAITPRRGDCAILEVDLALRGTDGSLFWLTGIQGSGFFPTELGQVVVIESPAAVHQQGSLRIYGAPGALLHEWTLYAPANPKLAPDGTALVVGHRDGSLRIDLADFRAIAFPAADLMAAGPAGWAAAARFEDGVVRCYRGGVETSSVALPDSPRAIAFLEDGSALMAVTARALLRIDPRSGGSQLLLSARDGEELTDLRIRGGEIFLGSRVLAAGQATGSMLRLDPDGAVIARTAGPSFTIPAADVSRARDAGIAWPLLPDSQHSVGNTYGEYQNYGGAPYPHPGIDVFGLPGQPVYAVRRGVVKAILTTAGEWHWRVAVGDSAIAGTTRGYLYAHLDQPTIAVHVGDRITEGQYLGSLVEWPVYDFHHCHFTRLEDSGVTWDGVWLSVHNPHLDISQQSETEAPVFEPARGSDLLAFCRNQTSQYLNPGALTGAVDIIAHVGDRIVSSWVCTVQELRYSIYPTGMPGYPVVDDKLSVFFDMTCDTYGAGQIDALLMQLLYKDDATCNTQGDYDVREFYHILTNSDGDNAYEQSDLNEAWDTTGLPDRSYVVRVTARDARGNETVESMVVTTANGNPSDVAEGAAAPRVRLGPSYPNPGSLLHVDLDLPARDRVSVAVLDAAGRRVRRLHEGMMTGGAHLLRWDGRGERGQALGPGVYFWRIESSEGVCTAKAILSR